jgi:hypothetical protein
VDRQPACCVGVTGDRAGRRVVQRGCGAKSVAIAMVYANNKLGARGPAWTAAARERPVQTAPRHHPKGIGRLLGIIRIMRHSRATPCNMRASSNGPARNSDDGGIRGIVGMGSRPDGVLIRDNNEGKSRPEPRQMPYSKPCPLCRSLDRQPQIRSFVLYKVVPRERQA